MNKVIINKNKKEELHGYQEWCLNDIIYHKGNYINSNRIGYAEWHSVKHTRYYIR